MSQNVSNACPNACKQSNHMYNVQQVKNSKVRYAKHQRLNLVLGDACSHEIEIHNSHGHKVSYLTYDLENIAV